MKEIEYNKLAKALLTEDDVDLFIKKYIISNLDLSWEKIIGHKKDYTLQMQLIDIMDTLNYYIDSLNGAFDFNVYNDVLEIDLYYDHDNVDVKRLKMKIYIKEEELESAG